MHRKSKKLDEYREFIWSNRPYIWLPILVVSVILAGVISFLFKLNLNLIENYIFWISVLIYLIISVLYYIKLRIAIKCKDT